MITTTDCEPHVMILSSRKCRCGKFYFDVDYHIWTRQEDGEYHNGFGQSIIVEFS